MLIQELIYVLYIPRHDIVRGGMLNYRYCSWGRIVKAYWKSNLSMKKNRMNQSLAIFQVESIVLT